MLPLMRKNIGPFFLTAMIMLLSFVVFGRGSMDGNMPPTHLFTGAEKHSISLTEAITLTANYRASVGPNDVKAIVFGRDAITQLLRDPNVRGMRIYFARKDTMPTFVLVAIDSSGNDLTQSLILDTGFPCPPFCDFASPLLK
jgi:hypothetical protein